jgi:hypothetical protein
MEKEFVTYEQALALKELGFDFEDYDILGFYSKKYGVTTHSQLTKNDEYNPAPLYQQAFRFFREKYGYDYEVLRSPIDNTLYGKKYDYNIWLNNEKDICTAYEFDFYEEAERACLEKLIELVKTLKIED